ncbi:hypothetical protein Phum_PHUM018980 [Pediculus humanus corporis]|uniref:Uncharacterized protein n=1 Tax=Pediculus humanus subsp. corporis TaxID=121224 RepID=E0V9P1_PEDHC|nr:uncharacterized protein Phum_PHUM018980 [Pediculus humanus corporis]EEB10110.1 hypothetical protein Phum_PHUM018980 [Pediculus humanus corporis]
MWPEIFMHDRFVLFFFCSFDSLPPSQFNISELYNFFFRREGERGKKGKEMNDSSSTIDSSFTTNYFSATDSYSTMDFSSTINFSYYH